jgi:hypothetical protein
MADVDKLLEAEQTIHTIAAELQRMRDAATLLHASQTQLDTLLHSTQTLVGETARFTEASGTIIEHLAAIDVHQQFADLRTLHGELEAVHHQLHGEVATVAQTLQQASVIQGEAVQRQTEQIMGAITQKASDLQEMMLSRMGVAEKQLQDYQASIDVISHTTRRHTFLLTLLFVVIVANFTTFIFQVIR